jgi:Ala-tRNA(Pro) deacylase
MPGTQRLQDYLTAEHVLYELHPHQPAYGAQQVAQSEHVPGKAVAKVVIVVADGKQVMLVLPASMHVDLDKARAALHANEVHLAQEQEFAATFPDCAVGALPPFGNLYGLPVYVDHHLADDESIVFPTGSYTEAMRMAYADFARTVQPAVEDIVIHG